MQAKMNFNTSIDMNKTLETIEAQYDYRWSSLCATHAQAADYFSVASQDLKVAQVCGIGNLTHGDRVRAFTVTLHAAIDFLGIDWVNENLLVHPFIHTATFYVMAGQVPSWISQRLSATELEVNVMRVRAEITKAFETVGVKPAPAVVTNVVTELESTEVTAEEAAAVEQAVEDAAAPIAQEAPVEAVEQAAVEEAAEEEGATEEQAEVEAPTPVVVDLEVSEAEANEKYGSRYGIDWVYEGE